MSMEITLEASELKLVQFVAKLRMDEALAFNRQQRHKASQNYDSGLELHLQGAVGERAVSNVLGLRWADIADDPSTLEGDVGPVHIRTTTLDRGCLVLHKDDPDAPFVLVTGKAPTVSIRGWIMADHGKKEQWWRTDVREPAFFVPQNSLHPIQELINVYRNW